MNELEKATIDAHYYGTGYLYQGKRISPRDVVIVTPPTPEPRVPEYLTEQVLSYIMPLTLGSSPKRRGQTNLNNKD